NAAVRPACPPDTLRQPCSGPQDRLHCVAPHMWPRGRVWLRILSCIPSVALFARDAMTNPILQAVEKAQLKSDLPKVRIGDTVDVHVRIIEGTKERIQVFGGVIIALAGAGATETITVRR